MSTWSVWGFGQDSPVTVVAANKVTRRPVVQIDAFNYQLDTTQKIIPSSLEVDINGLGEDPNDYEVNSDGVSFRWKGTDPLDPSTHHILTSFEIAA